MDFSLGTYGLGYLAGLLSTLSPCVLPLLPILIATAAAAHVLGPFALALGLMLSFSLVGIFLATLGASLGIETKDDEGPKAWRDIWSAGQGVGLIHDVPNVADLVARLKREYVAAGV